MKAVLSNHLYECLSILRQDPALCDASISCQNKTIHAHKVILMAHSRILCAQMLNLISQSEVHINLDCFQILPHALEQILSFLYSGDTKYLTSEDYEEVYRTAKLLQIEIVIKVVSNCLNYESETQTVSFLEPENKKNIFVQIFKSLDESKAISNKILELSSIMYVSCIKDEEPIENEQILSNSSLENDDTSHLEERNSKLKNIIESSNNLQDESQTEHVETVENESFPPGTKKQKLVDFSNGRKQRNRAFENYKTEKGGFECPYCDFNSYKLKVFTSHMKTHRGDRPFHCTECPKTFTCNKHLVSHLRIHSDERPFECDICGASFKDPKHRNRHMKLHSGEKPISCEESGCDQCFTDRSRMRKHVAAVHWKLKPHQCDYPSCNYAATSNTNLQLHKIKHKPKEERVSVLCDICGKPLKGARSIQQHMLLHIGQDIQCSICSYKSVFKSAVKSHMLRLHGVDLEGKKVEKTYKCELCNFQAYYISEFNFHKQKHTGNRPHKCSICNFDTYDKGSLKKHMRSHTGEMPFICSECGQSYSNQSTLSRHKRSHTGEKPYQCKQCDVAYADKKNLIAHEYKHTGTKPYMCHICSYTCMKNPNLIAHMKKEHSENETHITTMEQSDIAEIPIVSMNVNNTQENSLFVTQLTPQGMAEQSNFLKTLPQIHCDNPDTATNNSYQQEVLVTIEHDFPQNDISIFPSQNNHQGVPPKETAIDPQVIPLSISNAKRPQCIPSINQEIPVPIQDFDSFNQGSQFDITEQSLIPTIPSSIAN